MKLANCAALVAVALGIGGAGDVRAADRVKIANGMIDGAGPQASGVREFKGIPFAEPPVGALRWRAPQPVKKWAGVRQAVQFGPRCMQQPFFADMVFRSNGMSEDCLYLNVWTPAKSRSEKLPVLLYFYGGFFLAGDGSEPRYDGESMARKGVVAITVNYRLGAFGLLAHPELTKESPNHASGNYTMLDMNAALHWVRENIAAFGGDPKKITIAGESAGSVAVSALMVSPLSRDLIAGAIGESGSVLGTLSPEPLGDVEQEGVKLASAVHASTIEALRSVPAEQILKADPSRPFAARFNLAIDGYFFPGPPLATFTSGKQSHVPVLAGWNSEELGGRFVLGADKPTRENLEKAIGRLYGADAKDVLKEYAAANDGEAAKAAGDLASDRFVGYSTWKWIEIAGKNGGKPTYRYLFARPRPAAGSPGGAGHASEIEYALGNLATNKAFAWTPDDYKVSSTMLDYFANFVRTGDPNGKGLLKWPAGGEQLMRIDVDPAVERDAHRDRYLVLDKLVGR